MFDMMAMGMPDATAVVPVLALLIVVFTAYSVGGWIWETIYCSLVERRLVRRGVLYGPVCPLYGFGAIVCYYPLLVLDNPLHIFLVGMLLVTLMEYMTSLLLEEAFHRSFWDYSEMPLNLHGRVCLPASLMFGGFCLLVRYVIQPALDGILAGAGTVVTCDAAAVLLALYVADVAMSARRWELDTSRLPARVAKVVRIIPDSVRTPEEIGGMVDEAKDVAMRQLRRAAEDARERAGELAGRVPTPRHRRRMPLPDFHVSLSKWSGIGRLVVIARTYSPKGMVELTGRAWARFSSEWRAGESEDDDADGTRSLGDATGEWDR